MRSTTPQIAVTRSFCETGEALLHRDGPRRRRPGDLLPRGDRDTGGGDRRSQRIVARRRRALHRAEPARRRWLRSAAGSHDPRLRRRRRRARRSRSALERFSLVGVSAGGPYALAVAHQLGAPRRRASRCAARSSPFCLPHRTPGLRRRIRLPLTAAGAQRRSWSARVGDRRAAAACAAPGADHRVIAAHAAPGERDRLARDGRARPRRPASFLDAACGGVGGLVDDFLTYAHGWGFDPA